MQFIYFRWIFVILFFVLWGLVLCYIFMRIYFSYVRILFKFSIYIWCHSEWNKSIVNSSFYFLVYFLIGVSIYLLHFVILKYLHMNILVLIPFFVKVKVIVFSLLFSKSKQVIFLKVIFKAFHALIWQSLDQSTNIHRTLGTEQLQNLIW